MKNYFKKKEFYKKGTKVPFSVDKKLDKHIKELNKVRALQRDKVIISKKSGYRPVEYELAKDRSGKSQHTFEGLGAVDVTASDIKKLLANLINHTDYTRICYYPLANFIHCDFLAKEKQVFVDKGNGWIRTVKNHNSTD